MEHVQLQLKTARSSTRRDRPNKVRVGGDVDEIGNSFAEGESNMNHAEVRVFDLISG